MKWFFNSQPEDGTIRAETCSVYLLIFDYILKIVVLYGFLKFLLLYRQYTAGWPLKNEKKKTWKWEDLCIVKYRSSELCVMLCYVMLCYVCVCVCVCVCVWAQDVEENVWT
jgi:hypothetical protein